MSEGGTDDLLILGIGRGPDGLNGVRVSEVGKVGD